MATFQSDDEVGWVLAASSGIFVAGPIAWGMIADGCRPGRLDARGALGCLAGIRYAPHSH